MKRKLEQLSFFYLRSVRTVKTYLQSSRTVKTYLQSSRTVKTYPQSSRTVETYPQSSRTVETYPQSSRTVETYPRSSRTVETYPHSSTIFANKSQVLCLIYVKYSFIFLVRANFYSNSVCDWYVWVVSGSNGDRDTENSKILCGFPQCFHSDNVRIIQCLLGHLLPHTFQFIIICHPVLRHHTVRITDTVFECYIYIYIYIYIYSTLALHVLVTRFRCEGRGCYVHTHTHTHTHT
jgi:hypothetical protein